MPRFGKDGKRKIRKGAGLLPEQRRSLEDDAYEEDIDAEHTDYRAKRLDEEAEFDDGLPEDFEDEDVCSDDEDDVEDLLPASMRKRSKARSGGSRRQRTDEDEENEEKDEDEDEDGLGSSADSEEYTDLSKMLDDDDEDEDVGESAPSADRSASERMLKAAGLADKKRPRERTEGREEAEYAAGAGGGLSVDALVGSLSGAEGFGQLRRDLASLSRVAGASRASRAQLEAPLERVDKARVERQAATGAAQADVALWQGAVQKHREAEQLHFPLERTARAAANSTTSALTSSFKPTSSMEKGVEALLEAHGLSEGAIAKGEELELSNISEEEVKKRTAELRKMRDLLFHHERRLKRASKIKSKSYRRVHKKAKAARKEAEVQLAALDKQTAQRLALRKEVERVRERMTLKHKNTSRWAKNALKQQQKNPALRLAVAEQLQRGEELRRKQEDATAAAGDGSSDESISDSEEEGEEESEEGEEGEDLEDGVADLGRPRKAGSRAAGERSASGLLSAMQQESDPALPTKGVLGMGFMQRAIERQRAEAAAVLRQLEDEAKQAEAAANRVEDSDEDDDGSNDDEDGASGSGTKPNAAKRVGRAGGKAATHAGEEDDEEDIDEEEEEDGDFGEIRRLERQEKKALKGAKSAQDARRDALIKESGGGRRHVGSGSSVDADAAQPTSKRAKKAAAAAGGARGVLQACSSDGPITVAAAEQLLPRAADDEEDADEGGGGRGKARKGGKKRKQQDEEEVRAAEDEWGGREWLQGSGAGGAGGSTVPRNFVGAPLASPPQQAPLVTMDASPAAKGSQASKKQKRETAKQTAGAADATDAGTSKKLAAARRAVAAASATAEADAADAADGLVHGASLLAPSSSQQRLLDEAFPEAAAEEFAAEKARLAEAEGAPDDKEAAAAELPGWGSWGGLGARPDRRAEQRKQSAAEARAKLIAEASARRKDAALRNVIVSEKRDKKAAQFTTAGVPFPFTSREQFERSLRAPLGKEWNTAAVHKTLTAPSTTVVKGTLIAPIAMHHKAVAGAPGGKAKPK